METKDIHQTVEFKASPMDVYSAIMDAEKHAQFTGAEATIEDTVGAEFSVHNGYITGKNLELEPGKKIVQTWKARDEAWPDDHYSTVMFEFSESSDGTVLEFTHTDVPEAKAESIEQGWYDHYWNPMKEMLEQ